MDLTHPRDERTETEQRVYWGAKGVAMAAAIVALTAATLLAISGLTASRAHPSDSPVMALLVKQITVEPRNTELREQVRDLDRLARQAYLESVTFRRRCSGLLLAALIVMLGSLKLMSGVGKMVPVSATRDDDNRDVRTMASVAVLCFLAFLSGIVYVYTRENDPLGVGSVSPLNITGVRPSVGAKPVVLTPVPMISDERQAELYWPAFRGWRGCGLGMKHDPPGGWDNRTGSNVIWKTKVALPGFNSPVIWGQQLFVSGADQSRRSVYAFNASTGVLLWDVNVQVPDTMDEAPAVNDGTGYAASTMACDSRHAYAIFANGDLICVDHAGRVVWSRNLGVPEISYGYASSLLVYEGRLFVQRDIGKNSALLAFDGATGVELWRDKREETSAWCSPIMAMHKGAPILVLNGAGAVSAYTPTTGKRLWTSEGLDGEIAPSPASADGVVLLAMAGSGCLAVKLDDGVKVWANPEVDAPEIASPVMADGLAFVLADNGALTCLQAATGAILWKHEFDAIFNASPVIMAGHLYLTDITGRTWVLMAAEKFQLLATAQLGEAIYATAAAVGNRLYLRGREHLFCVGDASK